MVRRINVIAIIISAAFLINSLTNTIIAQTVNNENPGQNEIIVKFKKSVTDESKVTILKRLGAKSFRQSYGNHFHVVTVRDGEVEKMVELYSKNPNVAYAEPNYTVRAFFTPNDEFFPNQWHMSQINCEKAWDISTGQGVTVAVIDSGVGINGSDGFGGRLIQGRDFIDGDDNSIDLNGHGTHVAGTVAEETNNSVGVAGVAFNANILSIRVLNRFGAGSTSGVIDGIRWAADNGADVINLSLGGPDESEAEQEAIDEVLGKGVVIVAAAGNESGSVGFPAGFDGVIAVGSVRFDEQLSFFSNFGPEIDIVAPGGDATIDQNGDGFPDAVLQETFTASGLLKIRNIRWEIVGFQGTSQASPHVAGVAALILEKNPTLTPDDVRNVLTSSAKDLGAPGKDDTFGWGLVDAAAALIPAPPVPTSTPIVVETPTGPLPVETPQL